MLVCILDYHAPAHKVIENATRFAEHDLGDPPWLWNTIVSTPRWNSERVRQRHEPLHPRYRKRGHARVGRIACDIVEHYGGDARNIWKGQAPKSVVSRLEHLGAGKKISRMIVLALLEAAQISGPATLAPDIHVRRVLGRVFTGKTVSPDNALEIATAIAPRSSWKLDGPLWRLGKRICRPRRPHCLECYLHPQCNYARSAR